KYIQENQRILHESKLSHPTLDNICSIAQSCGFTGKLTGFGGGFVYILLPPSTQEEQIRNLSTKLKAEGFNVTTTSVSCSGVRIDD
ncbi:mevalonate kinase, partial [Lasius niger]